MVVSIEVNFNIYLPTSFQYFFQIPFVLNHSINEINLRIDNYVEKMKKINQKQFDHMEREI